VRYTGSPATCCRLWEVGAMERVRRRQIIATFEGQAVAQGRVGVDEFVRVVGSIQDALRHAGEEVASGRGRHRGPIAKSIAGQCVLELVRVETGSFSAVMELSAKEQPPLFDIGEEAIDALLDGIEDVSRGAEGEGKLPASVLPDIERIVERLGNGLDAIDLRGGREAKTVSLSARTAQALERYRPAPPPKRRATVIGRLREVDFKDHTAEIYDASETMVRVAFSPEQERAFKAAAMLRVEVEGPAQTDLSGAVRTIEAEQLQSSEEEVGEFWQPFRIEEVAARTGVRPVRALKELQRIAFWPEEEDADEAVREIYAERGAEGSGTV